MHCSQGGVNHAVKTYAIKFWGDHKKCQLSFLNYISHASVNKGYRSNTDLFPTNKNVRLKVNSS